MNYHPSWNPSAVEVFEKMILAHGGWEAWDKRLSVRLKLVHFDGFLVALKGLGKTFHAPKTLIIDPKNRKVIFEFASHADAFENGRLVFSPTHEQVADGRTLFKKHVFETWSPAHALYFFGYAWANYIGYPFILPQFELLNWDSRNTRSRFQIKFPKEFHTHCQVQTFYFDGQGSDLFGH